MKRVWRVVVPLAAVLVLAACVEIALIGESFVAMIAGIGLRYGDASTSSVPPLTPGETAYIDHATEGAFLWIFEREIALLLLVALIVYCFWRLARKVHRPPAPALIWVVRVALAGACASHFITLFLLGSELHTFEQLMTAGAALLPLLVCVVALVGQWAALGTSRWSWLTLLACLVLISLNRLTPTLRYAFLRLCGYRLTAGEGPTTLSIALPLLAVAIAISRPAGAYLGRRYARIDKAQA